MPTVTRSYCGRHTRLATVILAGLTGAPSLMGLAPYEAEQHVAALAVPAAVEHLPAAPAQPVEPVHFKVINALAVIEQNSTDELSADSDLAEPDSADEELSTAHKSFRFRPGKGVRFRTWCVRLCDGFYYPINNLTTRDKLADDDMKCQSSCSSESRLFFNTIVGYKAQPLTDMSGNSYTSLPTAFAYRSKINPSCTCRAATSAPPATARQDASVSAGSERLTSAANVSSKERAAPH